LTLVRWPSYLALVIGQILAHSRCECGCYPGVSRPEGDGSAPVFR